MSTPLSQPLSLPCGAKLSNRLCKSAMSEGLADANQHSTPRLEQLYRTWADCGAGLLLSGNIQVDRLHLERPGNVAIHDRSGLEALKRLAAAGKSGGAHFWAQLAHTGRQVIREINPCPMAPSVVEVDPPRGLPISFAPPREMTEDDIANVIEQFRFAAGQVREAGFTGIEFHAAHGYLFSQFLSPRTNLRNDAWGGSLVNRARLLLETLKAVRVVVGQDFPIGIKLNSSDFQKGGFTNAECVELVGLLNDNSLDLLELSGGSLEQPKLVGVTLKDEGEDGRRPGNTSTVQREAYFLDFAAKIKKVARMPVMVTGGFRSKAGMEAALAAGELDVVGMGRPLVADPRAAHRLLSGETEVAATPEKNLDVFKLMPWLNVQLNRLGDGLQPDLAMSGDEAVGLFMQAEGRVLSDLMSGLSATRESSA